MKIKKYNTNGIRELLEEQLEKKPFLLQIYTPEGAHLL